jgi:large conductance mechanosensitive channel
MSVFTEFREFVVRGNVADLAVGVIVGAAFNDIVKSLVDDIVMPPIGLVLSGFDFQNLQWVLKADNPATKANELVAVQYGHFINISLKFLIVAWVVFWMVKGMNAVRRWEAETSGKPETQPAPPPQERLLTEIRDLLKTERP